MMTLYRYGDTWTTSSPGLDDYATQADEQVEVVVLPSIDAKLAEVGDAASSLARRRDHAIAAYALRNKCPLQEAANQIGAMMKTVEEAARLAIHGRGPTVAGPGHQGIER